MTRRKTSYRKGDQSEYFALPILAALGLAVPVPRPEDVGIDYYCTLGQSVGEITQFFESYNVQVKSLSKKTETLEFGGPDKKGKWKMHEIFWILTQRTPLFLALVDRKKTRLDLFCTTTRWFAYHSPQAPCKLVFRTYTPNKNADLHNGEKTPLSVEVPAGIEAVSWELPLGQPVVSITSSQAADDDFIESAREVLRTYINLEMQNYVYSALRIPYFNWPLRIRTNERLTQTGVWVQWYTQPNIFTHMQKRVLAPLVATLLRTYEGVNDEDKVAKLGGLLSMLPKDPDLQLVRSIIQDGIDMQRAKRPEKTHGETETPLPAPATMPYPSSSPLSNEAKKVLATLWRYQDKVFGDDTTKRWTFGVEPLAGDFPDYLSGLSEAVNRGWAAVFPENYQCYLTDDGWKYANSNDELKNYHDIYYF